MVESWSTRTSHGYLMGIGNCTNSPGITFWKQQKLGGTKKTYTIQYTFPSNEHASQGKGRIDNLDLLKQN